MSPFNDQQSLMAGLSNGRGATVPREGPVVPSHQQIATLAYQKFLDRGGQHGFDRDDWSEARRELVAESLVTSRSHEDQPDA